MLSGIVAANQRYNAHRRSRAADPSESWSAGDPATADDPPVKALSRHPVSQRAQLLALLEDQGRVLELITRGASLNNVLRALVLAAQALSEGMLCAVVLLDENGKHVKHASAPGLPRAFCKALDLIRPPMVVDIATDARWDACRKLAARCGLRACWSTPIQSPGEVLGALTFYYRTLREPTHDERQLAEVAAQLAALAIGIARGPRVVARYARPRARLSPRELQVMRFIAQAQPVKRIASQLGVAISTVYTHRARIFEKLGIKSNIALARYAIAHRLVR